MNGTDSTRGADPASYGDSFADVYDAWYVDQPIDEIVEAVAGAGDPILELGVGTGLIALPLAELGHEVWGVDASAAMLEALRRKDPEHRIRAVRQDMADLDLGDTRFGVVLAAFNVLFNLPDLESKRRCFAGVAAHLAPGGVFVVDTVVPTDADLPPKVGTAAVQADAPVLTVSHHHRDDRVIRGQHVEVSDGDVRLRPWRLHYLRPEEIDGLAEEVGLIAQRRWSDWTGSAADERSQRIVSWYRRT